MDGWRDARQMETIIPHHYCVCVCVLGGGGGWGGIKIRKQNKQANSMGNLCPPPYFYLRC